MNRIFIEVKNGRHHSSYEYRQELFQLGLRWSKRQKMWIGVTQSMEEALKVKTFVKEKKLICLVYTESHNRAANYRDIFFAANKPMIGNKYICAYCLKPIGKEDTTVDHIISIKKAKANKLANKLMKILHIDNVNDEINLCACCQTCNSKKGSKAGLWIIRGFLGKQKAFVFSIYFLTIILLIVFISAFIFIFRNGGIK